MDDTRTGEMTPHQAVHPSPRPAAATSLATAAKHLEPKTSYLVHETTDAVTVAWDGMIIQPTLHNTPQPTGRFAKWPVHSFAQFRFDRLECGTHAFGHRMSMDRELATSTPPNFDSRFICTRRWWSVLAQHARQQSV